MKVKPKHTLAVCVVLCILVALFAGATKVGLDVNRTISVTPMPNSENVYVDEFPVVDWQYWLSVNPDIVAWVTVPGTNINYPIVQAHADDPNYWNFHDVYNNFSYLGCPFLHAENEYTGGVEDSYNAVFQGHNINGLENPMFAEFSKYADVNFANTNRRVLLQTPNTKMKLDVFAVEVIPDAGNADVLSLDFESQAQFVKYVSECVDNASVVLTDDLPHDQMWTFSTCSYYLTPSNERTVVHCSLVSKSHIVTSKTHE